MIKDFKDKVAVVTGAGSGIGRSLALAFAKREMKIVIAEVNEKALNDVSEKLMAGGTEVLGIVVDASDREQVAHLADETYNRFGKANILCNNAGVYSGAPIQLATLADWDWVLGLNQFGVIYGVSSFLPRMLKGKEACHIVNTASMAGHLTGDIPQYVVSKFAIVALSESLRMECFNTNVGVSVLCPGYVETQILKNAQDFRSERSDLFQPTDEMIEMNKTTMENIKFLLSSGMNPDIIAEKVIIAIKEDILHVMTHPEYMPLIKSRFESIHNDAMKLDRIYAGLTHKENETPKTNSGMKTFKHEGPGFTIQYPENWVQLQIPPTMKNAVFYASQLLSKDICIRVVNKYDPSLPPDYSLENATAHFTRILKLSGTDIKVLSDQQTKLRDGTPAAEGVVEYRRAGTHKVKVLILTTASGDKWISITISAIPDLYSEDLRDTLYTLEFN